MSHTSSAVSSTETAREEAERLVDMLRDLNREAAANGLEVPADDQYDGLADSIAERLSKAA